MSIYRNTGKSPLFNAVEFSPVSDGNFAFFYVEDAVRRDAARKWIAEGALKQEVVAETQVGNSHVFITHGDKSKEDVLKTLAAAGMHMDLDLKPKKISPWAVRGMLGISGQGLQLSSSMLRHKLDVGLFVFAVSNIAANIMGMTLGAQRSEDKHRLRFLKEKINTNLDEHLPEGQHLPAIDDQRALSRREPQPPMNVLDKSGAFIRRNSVYVGELGLRYFGALALAFPANKWGKGLKKIGAGAFKEAYFESRNTSTEAHIAGLGSLLGKNIAFLSKAEDPYDPKEKTLLDTVREKYTFKVGGAIEALSFGTLSYGAFKDGRVATKSRDRIAAYLSGAGGSLFTLAYVTRHWAQFGVKEMNMEELNAHVADSLAQMPPEKLPQLMADAAADLKEHFKDKPMEFGKIFTGLMTDLYRYHHIALDNLGTEPEERKLADGTAATGVTAKHTLNKNASRPKAAPPAAHTEKVASAMEANTQPSL